MCNNKYANYALYEQKIKHTKLFKKSNIEDLRPFLFCGLSIFKAFIHFCNVLFIKESENDDRLLEKQIVKKSLMQFIFFFYSMLKKLKNFDFSYVLHQNREFQACVHNTRSIAVT